MKRVFIGLATVAALVGSVQAQDNYSGLGLGQFSLGHARPIGSSWGLRAEPATGLYADWFPFGSSFRLVGGLTASDLRYDLNSPGTGNSFNLRPKYPTATTYLGVGYGHHALTTKGLGFYADVGIKLGFFSADVDTSLLGQAPLLQPDVEAQKPQLNDSLGGLKYLPSVSLGLVYRY
jgi:hypothetical protein